jgi:hypothetical protein
MDVNVIRPSYGVAALHQENEMHDNLAERFRPKTQHSAQISISEEHLWDSSSFSVTHRWDKLRTQFEATGGKLQQWIQNNTQTIADLEFLAPSAFGFKGATIRCEKCACTPRDAFAMLKKTCKSLVISKKQLDRAEKERADAEKKRAEAQKGHADAEKKDADREKKRTDTENRMAPNEPSTTQDWALEMLRECVTDKTNLVSNYAILVFEGAKSIHLAHTAVGSSLEALYVVGNVTSHESSSNLDVAKSPNDLSNARVDVEVGSSVSFWHSLPRV